MQLQQRGIAVKMMSLNYPQQSPCLALRDLGWQVLSIALSHVFGCELRVFLVTFQAGLWSAECRMHQRITGVVLEQGGFASSGFRLWNCVG